MSFDILNNIASLQAQNYLGTNSDFQSKTIQRVTSGLRIVNAGDDAAGLAIANGERSDEAVLTQGIQNANNGLSTLQTIDGGINNISGLLDRARTLATQAATGGTTTTSLSELNSEFQSVLSEINRQAQAIGMTAGGANSKSMQIFIGGGANDTSHSTAAAKINNGSITVDLSHSLLDTASLGLNGAGVQGAVITSGNSAVSTAITDANAKFEFVGPGFKRTTVDLTSSFTAANVTDQTSAVNVINQGIASVAANNAVFAAANIHASVDATGHLVFSGNGGFGVIATTTGSQALMAGSTVTQYAGNSSYSATWAGAALTAQDAFTLTWRDSSGAFHSNVETIASGQTLDQAAATISADASNGGIFAVNNGSGKLVFLKSDGGQFTVSAATAATTNGVLTLATSGSSSTVQGTATALDISSTSDAQNAVTALANAVVSLGTVQATVGRSENQLGYAINLAQSQLTNLTAAESRIRDADLASEAANLTKAQILMQAGTAALAQANSAPQVVLSLLKG